MATYQLLVLSNPVAGRDEEYNAWYSGRHIHDVTRLPGFVAAQRFRLLEPALDGTASPYRYAAIYEIETDDLAQALKTLGDSTGTAAVPMSEAFDTTKLFAIAMEPMTGRVEAAHP